MFAQPVDSVDTTRLFARTTSKGTQFLVYQMNYASPVENAMILPLPVRQPVKEQYLRFISLEQYGDFFNDLQNGFPYSPPFNLACSAPIDPDGRSSLEVFEVGNYIASFVPAMSDFNRLDSRFNLSADTWSMLPQYADYGFAVFQLAEGKLTPHPMAFEFESRMPSLYFPTLHVHDGSIHSAEQFDHVLYLQHAGFDSICYGYENADIPDVATGIIRSKFAAERCCDIARSNGVLAGKLLLHRLFIRGQHENRDTVIETSGDPETVTWNARRWFSWLPLLLLAGGFGWILKRRNRIRRLSEQSEAGDQGA